MIYKTGQDIDLSRPYNIELWCDGSADNKKQHERIAWGGVIKFDDAARWFVWGKDEAGGTSPYAELKAIEAVLEALPAVHLNSIVSLHSDSEWAIRCMIGEYKRNKFHETWDNVFQLMLKVDMMELKHVRGHVGIPENEACHKIADYVRRLGGISTQTLENLIRG